MPKMAVVQGDRIGFWLLVFAMFWMGWGISPLLSRTPLKASYSKPVPVEAPAGMREWRYVVIHHSGSAAGNEEIIQGDHLRRGMENGMAYHFLIGNGTDGLGDGEVVEGHRWKYQLQGGHCHQDFLNECGIGVCLVGNMNRKAPSARQVKSLTGLLLRLQSEFHIPDDNIHGHGQFYGEDSDCPGRYFPWTNLWTSLNTAYQVQVAGASGSPSVENH